MEDQNVAQLTAMRGGKVAFLTLLVLSRENNITQTSWRKKKREEEKTTHSLNNVSRKIDSISQLAENSSTEHPEYLAGLLESMLQGQKN